MKLALLSLLVVASAVLLPSCESGFLDPHTLDYLADKTFNAVFNCGNAGYPKCTTKSSLETTDSGIKYPCCKGLLMSTGLKCVDGTCKKA